MGKTLRNIMHRDGQNSASIKIHIIFDKYLIRAQMKCLGGQICFTIIPDGLIDSILETLNHIHCENTSRRIFEPYTFFLSLCAPLGGAYARVKWG